MSNFGLAPRAAGDNSCMNDSTDRLPVFLKNTPEHVYRLMKYEILTQDSAGGGCLMLGEQDGKEIMRKDF